jgi:HAD superfamily hydrolase (TIGR01450 family)
MELGPPEPPATWLLDLDGVVWRGDRPIPGSPEGISRLRDRGARVGFCTNNSSLTLHDYRQKLTDLGIEVQPHEILTSAVAVAGALRPGERVHLCAGPGVLEAVEAAGATRVPPGEPADTVIVGFHRDFDYEAMTLACRTVWDGARLLATNDDPRYPSDSGPAPGCGAILASIERATGHRAEIAGKPHPPMVALVRERFGPDGIVVGDTPATDGALASALGWPFALVATGNTDEHTSLEHAPALRAADLAEVVATLLDR